MDDLTTAYDFTMHDDVTMHEDVAMHDDVAVEPTGSIPAPKALAPIYAVESLFDGLDAVKAVYEPTAR